jgi:hypothetical protein
MKFMIPFLMSMLRAASVAQSQPSPQPNNFNLPFVLSVIGAFIASFVVAKLYAWPTLRSLPRYNALRILASLHVSAIEIKPATNYRNDPASGFCGKYYERRGIFLSNKPDTNELHRACLEEKCRLTQFLVAGSFR